MYSQISTIPSRILQHEKWVIFGGNDVTFMNFTFGENNFVINSSQ